MSNSFEQPTSTNECTDLLLQLNNLCSSESLSLERLREHIERFGFDQGKNHDIIIENKSYTFFLNVCENDKFDGEIIRYILNIFPEAAVKADSIGFTPLHHACRNKNVTLDIIRLLIEAAPDFQETNVIGLTPLHQLCRNQGIDGATFLDILELLLTLFPEAAVTADAIGFTPLHCACCNRNVTFDIIRLLVEAAPDTLPHTANDNGNTPLHQLCSNTGVDGANMLKILELLLTLLPEAAVTADSRGFTPLHHACDNYGNVTFDIIRALVQAAPDTVCQATNDDGETPLQLLCRNQGIDGATLLETVELLLTLFAEAAVIVDSVGNTPLHHACFNINVTFDVIRLLVEAAPDTACQATNDDGDTPLNLLCRNQGVGNGAIKIIEFFLEQDPELARKVGKFGRLPLHDACRFQSGECCSKLISTYPDSVQISDSNGVLPLHFACQSNNLEMVQCLHELYPNAVNQPTEDGMYPINFVMRDLWSSDKRDAVEVVKYLLDCDPSVKLQKVVKKSRNNILTRYSHISMFCYLCGDKESNVDIGIEIIKVLYDANPKAIIYCGEHIRDLMGPRELRPELWEFIEDKLEAWREIRETTLSFDEELRSLCGSESLSLEKLRETFNRFGLTNVDKIDLIDCDRIVEGGFFIGACKNENFSEEIIRFLLDFFPGASRVMDEMGFTPFHLACYNRRVTLNIIQLIHEAAPDHVLQRTYNGSTPLHMLCQNQGMDEAYFLEIFQFLHREYPGAADISDSNGCTPLHIACHNTNPSLNIIEPLVGSMNEAAASSILRATNKGDTPLHLLCSNEGIGRASFLEILEFLLRVCPLAARTANANVVLPLHCACCNKNVTFDIIRALVEAAPDTACQAMNTSETPLHLLCRNEGVDGATFLEILEILLRVCQVAACIANANGVLPLHCACCNKNVTFDIIRLLVEAAPDTACQATNNDGETPLHFLCCNNGVDDGAIKIIEFFLEQDPESARKVNMSGGLPLHYACLFQHRAFCSALISAYPDSVQISANNGVLPLHFACQSNNLETVQCMHELYPNAVNQPTEDDMYPINFVVRGQLCKDKYDAVEVVKYLLDCDPSVKSQKILYSSGFGLRSRRFQLLWFCNQQNSNLDVGTTVQIVRALYDAYPQAIYDFEDVSPNMKKEVRAFIEGELVYAGQARDAGSRSRSRLEILDENGQLELNTALRKNASLGSIKLLVEAYPPTAVRMIYSNSSLPLQVACRHHNSPSVVHYLLDLAPELLRYQVDGNNILHLACRGAKCETIAMLLENTTSNTASLATKRDNQGKLPIELLFESSEVDDRESVEYVGTVFRLLQAYPETPWHSL